MGHKHVTLTKLWDEYILENPDGYRLTRFRFHCKQNTKAKVRSSTVLKDLYNPGEKGYLDFTGDRLSYIDLETGETVRPQTFVASLPCTDYGYMKAHNRKRMQQHPSSRKEHFPAIEKPALKPLPTKIFEIKSYTTLKVAINGCIYLGLNKHYCSVPYGYIHKSVKVIYTRTLVRVFSGEECIATHTRDYAQGKYTLVRGHLASHSREYRERSKEYYINRASAVMAEFGEVVRYMFLTATTA